MKSIILNIKTLALLCVFVGCDLHQCFGDGRQTDDPVKATIVINSKNGHEIIKGISGYNVRIGDKVWSYTHPDFRKAVHEAQPGWLRYFSGTMGDAFNSATGQYDLNFAYMFDKQSMYLKGHMYSEIKGPQRIVDLYELLGEVGGKLVVTVNAFTETPEMTGELARFCKNNNIKVEAWQFCNEPFFFFPRGNRQRFWFNDGQDYAEKMKPHAQAILKVFPEANLALQNSSDWSGTFGFMKDISDYQKANGRFWNMYSKHSYAPHISGKESFEDAYKRANSRIIEVTGKQSMEDIESNSWKKAPVLITEFGVWNPVLNGLYSAIYNVEYALRQLQHDNLYLIASHEISNKFLPAKNKDYLFHESVKKGLPIVSDTIQTGVHINDEGRGFQILHEATNNATFTFETSINGGAMVPGFDNKMVEGTYARAFKGSNGFNYLAITNRSEKQHDFEVALNGLLLEKTFYRRYLWAEEINSEGANVRNDTIVGSKIPVPPYSIMMVKWHSGENAVLNKSRIYKAQVAENGIVLNWWKTEKAEEYLIEYGNKENNLNQQIIVKGEKNTSCNIKGTVLNKKYYFRVTAKNAKGKSEPSDIVSIRYKAPEQPSIFKVTYEGNIPSVLWKSVENATGYKVKVSPEDSPYEVVFDAKNVFGYRIKGLDYEKKYNVQVIPYNGLGDGKASKAEKLLCKKNIPVTPREVSAKQTVDNNVRIDWIAQDSLSTNVRYRIYRGKEPHKFKVLAEGVRENFYIDKNPSDKEIYYTVKAYTDEGDSGFYPNIGTLIKKGSPILSEK